MDDHQTTNTEGAPDPAGAIWVTIALGASVEFVSMVALAEWAMAAVSLFIVIVAGQQTWSMCRPPKAEAASPGDRPEAKGVGE